VYPDVCIPRLRLQFFNDSIGILGGRRFSAKITRDAFAFRDGLAQKLAFQQGVEDAPSYRQRRLLNLLGIIEKIHVSIIDLG
jgi:hypothetical protein